MSLITLRYFRFTLPDSSSNHESVCFIQFWSSRSLKSSRACAPRLSVRFAALTHDLGKGTTPQDVLPRHIGHEQRSVALLEDVCRRLRVPNDCRELGVLVAREHGNIHRSGEFGAAALTRLVERCDALRKPDRFAEALPGLVHAAMVGGPVSSGVAAPTTRAVPKEQTP